MPESITLRLIDSKPPAAVLRISTTCLDPATAVVELFVSLSAIVVFWDTARDTNLKYYCE